MAESLAPIDESVAIPPAVKAAAARAESYYQAPAQSQPEQTPAPPAAQPAPARTPEPPAPAPTPDPHADTDIARLQADLVKRERDYNALLGRNAQQREYIAMQQTQLSQLHGDVLALLGIAAE